MWDNIERRSDDRGNPQIPRILIVDDESSWQEILKRRLSKTARIIDSANSISQMYEKLKENHYGFIVLDNKLPDGMGFDEAEKIKQLYPKSYLILLTAFRRSEPITTLMERKIVVAVIDKLSDIDLMVNILELKNGLQLLKESL